ncbi:MAG TPA: SDR family oxidoreductase [Methanoregulaceae archaeon]|nr:SDR family oxidoreductase [Methanoregulaceae archaeon]
MDRLKGKVAIIVGATSGIGEAMTNLFAQEGAKVVFTGRREELGKKIEADVRARGGEATFRRVDANSEAELEALADFTAEKYGKIDILCNNAGILISNEFTQIDLEKDFDATIATNLRSQFAMCKHTIPYMIRNGGGSIVNTASIGAFFAMPFQVSYAASKAGVKQMTRSLAIAYADKNIRVNCICPGLTHSGMEKSGDAFDNAVLPLVPVKRAAQPIEMAYGALYLASDEASYTTGHDLIMTGGLGLQ